MAEARRRIDNDPFGEAVRTTLVDALPRVATSLPPASQQRSLTLGGHPLAATVARVLDAVQSRRGTDRRPPGDNGVSGGGNGA